MQQSILNNVFTEATLPLPDMQSGKVRDNYLLDKQHRLLITTDRLSAFDRILGYVPYKGQVLNELSAWWFTQTADIIPNHMLTIPDPNALVARNVQPYPVEVIVRGYITGITQTALWQRYAQGEREIYGYHLPEGLQKNTVLPKSIITPTTKGGPTGHDERLTCSEVVSRGLLDEATWDTIQQAALALFARGQQLANQAGLILVDTKYEFGQTEQGEILLIDEIHTPDSSRFWLLNSYAERIAQHQEPDNFDKEFIRLEFAERGYYGEGVPPVIEDNIWLQASERYIKIYEMLTRQDFVPGGYPILPRLIQNLKKAGWMT